MTNNELKNKLQVIADTKEDSIEKEVAKEALNHNDIKAFFTDLIQYGCASGIVSSMIYYTDTHTFFDKYYNHIEEIREEFEASIGQSVPIKGDLKNTLTWFAFEQTAYNMGSELGIEI